MKIPEQSAGRLNFAEEGGDMLVKCDGEVVAYS